MLEAELGVLEAFFKHGRLLCPRQHRHLLIPISLDIQKELRELLIRYPFKQKMALTAELQQVTKVHRVLQAEGLELLDRARGQPLCVLFRLNNFTW